jgi:formylglycine-generating enzyme required for sulfatase activity
MIRATGARVFTMTPGPIDLRNFASGERGRSVRIGVTRTVRVARSTGWPEHPVVHVGYADAQAYCS